MILYRLIWILAIVLIPIGALIRVLQNKDSFATFGRRVWPERGGDREVIWLHAVSFGELQVLELLLDQMRGSGASNFLITVSNVKAYKSAKQRFAGKADVVISPLEFPFTLTRFISAWRPKCLITIENEIFPNRLSQMIKRDRPVYFVNARLSEKSFQSWHNRPAFKEEIFKKIDFVWAQNEASGDWFKALGVRKNVVRQIENLKRLVRLSKSMDTPKLPFERDKTLLAASTHPGEEEIIIRAFREVRTEIPDLKLILAPRHIERATDIQKDLNDFNVTLRSTSEPVIDQTDVYLADTHGEMAHWYSAAAITFVGGSLVKIGGHTPYEPTQFGSAILHGPHFSNFEAEYQSLAKVKGAIECTNAEEISSKIKDLMDVRQRNTLVANAQAVIGYDPKHQKILEEISQHILARL